MQELWAAVLGQAINDALGRSGFVRKDYTTRGVLHSPHTEALAWFEQGGADFRTVAALAGIDDADALRHAVLTGRVGPIYLGGPEPRKRRTTRTEGKAA